MPGETVLLWLWLHIPLVTYKCRKHWLISHFITATSVRFTFCRFVNVLILNWLYSTRSLLLFLSIFWSKPSNKISTVKHGLQFWWHFCCLPKVFDSQSSYLKVVRHIEMPKAAPKSPFVIFKNYKWYWNEISKILSGYLKSTNLY